MSFASWYYPFFLLITATLFWLLPARFRTPLLVAASFVFYAYWDVRFIALLLAATIFDYTCSNAIHKRRLPLVEVAGLAFLPLAWLAVANLFKGVPESALISAAIGAPVFIILWALGQRLRDRSQEKFYLVLAIIGSLSLLAFFKYAGWFADNLRIALAGIGLSAGWSELNILLPIGISFHIFQSISYVVDVYKKRVDAEPSFLRLLNMICFFPQLMAGPIERAAHILPQLHFVRAFEWKNVLWGCHLILIGYFLKIYVADNCAVIADYFFNTLLHPSAENALRPHSLGADWSITGTLAFAFQIYGDFAGYSLIARGSALFFGVTLVKNFSLPYLALTPSDFWRRWHMSLSSWFRDYVYIPLGGNRGSSLAVARNLGLTMLLAGLWHGASWMFVIWGGIHAAALIAWRAGLPELHVIERRNIFWKTFFWLLTFSVVLVGWAFFRASSLADIYQMGLSLTQWTSVNVPNVLGSWKWLALHIVPLVVITWLVRKDEEEADIARLPLAVLVPMYWLMITLVLSSGSQRQEFIYFQF